MRGFTVTACLLLFCVYAHAFVPAPASLAAIKTKNSCLQQHRSSPAFVLNAAEDEGEQQPANEVNNTNAADDAARQAAQNVSELIVFLFFSC
jgi:hypothetical protein